MRKETILTLETDCGEKKELYGFHFGKGEKSACITGAMCAGEVQQLYICSQLVKTLKELEEKGAIVHDNEILVVPSVCRQTETLQQPSAAEPSEKISEYHYHIQFTGSDQPGTFVPHVQIVESGHQNASLANLFGLPYVLIRHFKQEEEQKENTAEELESFSVYAGPSPQISEQDARMAVSAVLRFLTRMGILRYTSHSGYIASVLREDDLTEVKNDLPGILRRCVEPGQEVHRGEVLAFILDPLEGETISEILSPTDGIVFFAVQEPVVSERTVLYKIIRRLHA